jgi:hypothetical protein
MWDLGVLRKEGRKAEKAKCNKVLTAKNRKGREIWPELIVLLS